MAKASLTVVVQTHARNADLRQAVRSARRQHGVEVRVASCAGASAGAAFNAALADASTEFITFLDPASRLARSFAAELSVAIARAEQEASRARGAPDVIVSHAYSDVWLYGPGGRSRWCTAPWEARRLLAADVHGPTALIRCSCARAAGCLDEDLDTPDAFRDLWLRFAARGWRGVRVPRPLVHAPGPVLRPWDYDRLAREVTVVRRLFERHRRLFLGDASAASGPASGSSDAGVELLRLMNTLLRQNDVNWLDESGEPVEFMNLYHAQARYEPMLAVRVHRRLQRLADALPGPAFRVVRMVARACQRALP